jgi:RimJ/RimL family protein N-acetyltransferase
VREWLTRPHVREWWDAPSTGDFEEEYGPVVDGRDSTQACIALLDEEPIGFIQCYVVKDSGHGWWPDETDPGARGIDQFLADPARLGQGLGTRMVRTFVERIFADRAVTRIQVDPSRDNARAIRCYEKAGFRRIGEVDTPDGRALLMVTIPNAAPGEQISG